MCYLIMQPTYFEMEVYYDPALELNVIVQSGPYMEW